MPLPMSIFVVVFVGGFLFGLGEILHIQAKNRARSSVSWITLGCLATLAAGAGGYWIAPTVVENLELDRVHAQRAFYLCIWIPAVAIAALIGGILKMLGPVVRTPAGSAFALKAEASDGRSLFRNRLPTPLFFGYSRRRETIPQTEVPNVRASTPRLLLGNDDALFHKTRYRPRAE